MGTITKALNLLTYFSESAPEISLMDFKALTGTDKATIHRHLTELLANGYLEQNKSTRKYRLGASILRLASIREKTFPARRIVSQWVRKLSEETGELVHASVIQQMNMSPLCFHDAGIGGTRVYYNEADILPLHATASGLAAIAFGPSDLLQTISRSGLQKFTDFTITDFEQLQLAVERTRQNGFAYIDQAYEQEVCSLAVPFFENDRFAYGSIAIAMPASRMKDADKAQYVRALWNAAENISRDLGGTIPQNLKNLWLIAA